MCFAASGLRAIEGHSFYGPTIGSDSIVLDLGAHAGRFSAEVQGTYGCLCYAIEASPTLHRALPEQARIYRFNYVMGDRDGRVPFHISGNSEASSEDRDLAARWGTQARVNVAGTTLSTFLDVEKIGRIDLLKCDIEGSELALFRSMRDDTARRVAQFTVEFHDFIAGDQRTQVLAIRRRLERLGFFSITLTAPYGHGDVLFINRALCEISKANWAKLLLFKHLVIPTRGFRERALRVVMAVNRPIATPLSRST